MKWKEEEKVEKNEKVYGLPAYPGGEDSSYSRRDTSFRRVGRKKDRLLEQSLVK